MFNKLTKYSVLYCILTSFFFIIPLTAQDTKNALPDGYRSIHLGMSLDITKQELENDSFFGYRGDRDVSLLPSEGKSLIETLGDAWLEHSWFQFYEESLYTITLNFNPTKIDYYSLFTTLTKKYGEPDSLSPQKTTWQNNEIQMILEQPCSIKYIDLTIFNSLLDQSIVNKTATEMVRQDLLEAF